MINPMEEGLTRCAWCTNNPVYTRYHDEEWGVLIEDDRQLFEFIVLEGAQAGLNWLTILLRREEYRMAFDQFDYEIIARYEEGKVQELMQNPGIIRHQAKIRSTITNARAFIEIQKEFGSFLNYTRSFFPDTFPIIQRPKDQKAMLTENGISKNMSRDMKKRGFKFFGSVICYAHLQATGAINDHFAYCFKGK